MKQSDGGSATPTTTRDRGRVAGEPKEGQKRKQKKTKKKRKKKKKKKKAVWLDLIYVKEKMWDTKR